MNVVMTQNLGNSHSDASQPDAMPALFSDEPDDMCRCTRCKLPYQADKSTSSLRLTYCSFLCELGDLGFSMQGLEHMQRDESKAPKPEELPEPAPAD